MTTVITSSRIALALALLAACGPGKSDTDTDDDVTGDTPAVTEPPTSSEPTSGDPTEEDPGNPAGVCDPSADSLCPTDYICCSDDPATVGGKTPNFFNPGVVDDEYGVPIFSGNNNSLSTWGRCVEVGGFTSPFASGCPVPCNPTWEPARLTEICGTTSTCCSFTQLDPAKDCVLDPDTQRWRAVTGKDIGKEFNGVPEMWGPLHTTNQDPYGTSCMLFSGPGGMMNQEVFEDCVEQLSVADQRGFCYAPAQCPCTEDLCAQKNPDYVPKCAP
jgi:hypothetical protein